MTPDPRTLTKAELAELLFDRVGLNKREAKDIVDTFFEEIRDALARRFGEAVGLRQFPGEQQAAEARAQSQEGRDHSHRGPARGHLPRQPETQESGRNRKSSGEGKGVSASLALGGRRHPK